MATFYRLRLWLGAVALALLVAALYSGLRDHSFLQFDDTDYVSENAVIRRGLTLAGVWWSFSGAHAGNWHPVTWLSHMTDVQVFGMNAGAHLLVNAALHFATSLLVFLCLQKITWRVGAAFLVAALFAVHPLHVESVAWVAERKDVLCGFFWMLTVAAYLGLAEAPSRGRYAIVLACFALALMSKPMAVTLPAALVLIDFWLAGLKEPAALTPDGGQAFRPGDSLRQKLPMFAMSFVACVITYLAQSAGGAVQSAESFPWLLRLANAPVAYMTYVAQAIWPANLAALYPYPESIPVWKSAGASILLFVVTVIALRARERRPYVAFGWLWFLITLLPVIGIVQVGSQPYADRYMYMPATGLFVIAAWGLSEFAGASRARQTAATAAGVAAVIGLGVVTFRQVDVWRDSVTLWTHAIAVTDRNFRAHTNLGFALADAGLPDRAEVEYREAIAIEPAYANARNYLGALLSERGRPGEAVVELRAALAMRPRFVEAHNNLGLALAALDQTGDAIGAFREAVRLNPAFGQGWNNLGIALASAGQIDQAIVAFRKSVELQPESAEARSNLETALKEKGKGKF